MVETTIKRTRKERPGDLPRIAKITNYSLSHVQTVSRGLSKNEGISWAIARIQQLREKAWLELEAEYKQKFDS